MLTCVAVNFVPEILMMRMRSTCEKCEIRISEKNLIVIVFTLLLQTVFGLGYTVTIGGVSYTSVLYFDLQTGASWPFAGQNKFSRIFHPFPSKMRKSRKSITKR